MHCLSELCQVCSLLLTSHFCSVFRDTSMVLALRRWKEMRRERWGVTFSKGPDTNKGCSGPGSASCYKPTTIFWASLHSWILDFTASKDFLSLVYMTMDYCATGHQHMRETEILKTHRTWTKWYEDAAMVSPSSTHHKHLFDVTNDVLEAAAMCFLSDRL